MDKTLREHIIRLEERIRVLSEQLMETSDLVDVMARNRVESEIRAANLALSHYKAALELERSLG